MCAPIDLRACAHACVRCVRRIHACIRIRASTWHHIALHHGRVDSRNILNGTEQSRWSYAILGIPNTTGNAERAALYTCLKYCRVLSGTRRARTGPSVRVLPMRIATLHRGSIAPLDHHLTARVQPKPEHKLCNAHSAGVLCVRTGSCRFARMGGGAVRGRAERSNLSSKY